MIRETKVYFSGILCLLGVLVLGGSLAAQQQQPQRKATVAPTDVPAERRPGMSELARDNYGRVAASVLQIKDVLSRDPGIMVEVKRLVAKEASDSGQFVNDEDLTDEAVNDRLVNDLTFRSAVTRLVQRYGYLLPQINPDSDAGKQQEFILKERARRQVQIESQDDPTLQPNPNAVTTTQAPAACDPNETDDCNARATNRVRQDVQTPDNQTPRDEIPQEGPRQNAPIGAGGATQMLRTDATAPGSINDLSQGNLPSLVSISGMLDDFSSVSQRTAMSSRGANIPTSLLPNQNSDLLEMASRGSIQEMNPDPNARNSRMDSLQSSVFSNRKQRGPSNKDLPPVTMVHSPNPYSDIPSLYDLYVQAASRDLPPKRFGGEVFRDGLRDSRAIPMDLPVGPDYVVGPGDSLSIDLWGGMSSRLIRLVDREGRVSLPEAGPLQVSGHTLGEVQQAVERAVATQFRDTSADVSVARLRTVRVYIVGEVREPGAYDISSLSTALNALVAAGGVTTRGSLRKLKHYRDKQLIEEIDAYDLLLHGVKPDAKKLESGDTLMVPPIGPQVTVTGMVRRPAIYELNGEKSLAEGFELAGGILPAAALKHVEVQRVEAHEKRTMLSLDLTTDTSSAAPLNTFNLQDGDEIHVFPIAPYNQDTIYLQGHVLRPGRYSFHKEMKLNDLVSSYQDLLPEPAAHYAEIVRLNAPDFRPSVESFDLASAMANPEAAPKLQPLDTVRIFSRFDFEPAPEVWVGGEVRSPGKYVTSGQAHLRDAIYLAGGLSPDASIGTAQLFRTELDGNTKIVSVNLKEALAGDPMQNVILAPRDRLLIHRNAQRVEPAFVDIRGEVAKPGRYPLTDDMKIEDLIHVSGGFKRSADKSQASLARYATPQNPGEHVEVQLTSLLSGNETENLALRNGDVLTIRQVPGWGNLAAKATVRGEVAHPGSYGIQPGEHLSSVLLRAGGYTPEAFPYGAVLMRSEVREVEEKSHQDLIRRVQAQQANIKLLPEADQEERNAKLTAIAQTQATLDQLRLAPPVGRVVVHIDGPIQKWKNTASDVELRDGDILVIPKKTGYVLVTGQVFNSTAVSYRGGRSANWYLGQAGGTTQLADKKGIFVVRADGSVISAKNHSTFWSGNPLNATLRPGDTVVVPEKALNVGNKNWTALLQAAQIASSIALTVSAFHL